MSPPEANCETNDRRERWISRIVVLLAVSLAYANGFSGPFVFDDVAAVASARQLVATGGLPTDPGETTSGRPLLLLSLAANVIVSRESVWSYHLANITFHAIAALLLQAVLRRALRVASPVSFGPRDASWVATAVAVCWSLHPLQTAAVIYVVQRAEILAGIGILLGMHGFLRAQDSPRPRGWLVLSVLGCLAGVLAKEVAIVAPILILLFDWMFVGRGFRTIRHRRGVYFACLAAVGAVQGILTHTTRGRGGTAGFDTPVGVLDYAMTQAGGILHYIRLTFWPADLVFDYGTTLARWSFGSFAAGVLVLAIAGYATASALRRQNAAAFGACAFFILLAPSSSVVPIASQVLAEHRMYLASALPILALVLVLRTLPGALPAMASVSVVLLILTHHRNEIYRTEHHLWLDTVIKRPENARAHHNLGLAHLQAGKIEDAARHLTTAARLDPDVPDVHYNLGLVATRSGKRAEALEHYAQAIAREPRHARAHNNRGSLLLDENRPAEAADHFRAALQVQPAFAEAHQNLAEASLRRNDPRTALAHSREALQQNPRLEQAHVTAGNAAAALGDLDTAERYFETALHRNRNDVRALSNLGNIYNQRGKSAAAIPLYERAIALQPEFVPARRNLALTLLQLGRLIEAETHLTAWSKLQPEDPQPRAALRRLQIELGRP